MLRCGVLPCYCDAKRVHATMHALCDAHGKAGALQLGCHCGSTGKGGGKVQGRALGDVAAPRTA